MTDSVIQTSFAGGELSPTLFGRVDLDKYHIGAAKLLNFFVDYRGGVSNRAGFESVARCRGSTTAERLLPFQFSTVQNYVLEFSDLKMRVIKNGAQILNAAKTIISVTQANPGVFTVTAHGYATGTEVYMLATGMTQINAKHYFIVNLTANTFSLVDWNGTALITTGFGAFIAGTVASIYEVTSPYAAADLALLKFTQSADTMTITHPSYAPYNLARVAETNWTFTIVANAIFATYGNPATVTYDQQRLVYAGSNANPLSFQMSNPGSYNTFTVSSPVIPSDAVFGTLVSKQVNNIKYMVSMPGGLIMLTGGGAWQVSGGSAGAVISPATITASPQSYNGCADVEPLTINTDILYVQQRGAAVRDLAYDFYKAVYTGTDISLLANHLFKGYSIIQWAYAEDPFKVVWVVRSDGALLSLTYLKDQLINGWAQHQTQGRVTSITSIQEGQEIAVYVIVQRLLQGQLISFIERLHSRTMPYGVEDGFFVDAGLATVQNTVNAVLTIGAATGSAVNYNASSAVFSAGNVGSIIRAGGGIATITAYIDTQNVTCRITKAVTDINNFHTPVTVWPQAANTWSMDAPKTVFSGLDYLEGETVSILGDGNVMAQQVVLNGTITLSQACTKVIVGLPYKAQFQSLYLDTGAPTIQGKRKNISALTARVDQTRGIEMGQKFTELVAFKDRDLNTIGQPIALFTGDQRMSIPGGWQTEGQICIQQSNPLPTTILAIIPEITLGDTGK